MKHFFEQFDNIVIVNKPKDETDEENKDESKKQ